MEVNCQHCQTSMTYAGPVPRFCQHCGANIETTESEDVTVAPITSRTDTGIAPSVAGEQVGQYELVRLLGSGGMGVVWEAIDKETSRLVALKMLSRNMVSDETSVKRFIREAQTAAKISHPNVTFIFGAGQHNERPYIAMELMPGRTLGDTVSDSGPMQIGDAVDGIINVVDGLIAAHRLGLIHRDVKPANCFLDTDDSVKIGDFGLSKSTVGADNSLTQTGTFMGTPAYAAPEQIRSADLDARTDIYSVGATLYNLLTGRPPFVGDAMSVTAQIISDAPAPAGKFNSGVPADLDRILGRCLEKNPARRFQDLTQLKKALMPFASRGTSLANFGRRLSAYMIDYLLISTVVEVVLGVIGMIKGIQGIGKQQMEMADSLRPLMLWGTIGSWCVIVLYFAIWESLAGRGIGKRLMGLSVVDGQGARPAFWRALLRAIAIPGCFGATLAWGIYAALYREPPVDAPGQFVATVLGTLFMFVPLMICVSTMRASNRFRGLHGFLSGTRVLRIESSENRMLNIPVVQPRTNTIDAIEFGPYTTTALLSENRVGKVFLGHDVKLQRHVWLVVNENDDVPCSERINLARITRQRWLGGGRQNPERPDSPRWDAYEAVEGLPIASLMGMKHDGNWPRYRRVLKEIAVELRTALDDGTLPAILSLPQIWLGRDGHAKLLDSRLVDVAEEDNPLDAAANDMSSEQQAVTLVQDLAGLLNRTNIFPVAAQCFLDELVAKPATLESLDEAIAEISGMSDAMEELTWDSRAGVLGLSVGIEMLAYYLVGSGLFLYSYYKAPVPNEMRLLTGMILALALPAVFGAWFRGGPVFSFMGIDVCNRKGKPASRLLCGLRNVISWIPTMAFLGAFMMLLIAGGEQVSGIPAEPGSLAHELKHNPIFALILLLSLLLAMFAMVAGAAFSLFSPRRGLQDFLTGTILFPR